MLNLHLQTGDVVLLQLLPDERLITYNYDLITKLPRCLNGPLHVRLRMGIAAHSIDYNSHVSSRPGVLHKLADSNDANPLSQTSPLAHGRILALTISS